MHSIFRYTHLASLRLPSFAGHAWTDRVRTTGFALLGLTAAAGLVLVGLFAHPGFPLLEPAPLPNEPSASESVADAKKVTLRHRPSVPVHPRSAARSNSGSGGPHLPQPSGSPAGTEPPAPASVPVAVEAPAPVSVPAPPNGENGGKGGGTGPGGGSNPAPTAAPAPASAAAPSPQPAPSVPEATASSPPPEAAPAPGNSSSAAAAEHASERGIEASSKSVSSEADASTAEPGNGDGLANGHDK